MINYSLTIVYLMLKNNEVVNYKKLSEMFPFFANRKYGLLFKYLTVLVDGDLYRENKNYKLKEWDLE